MDAATIARDAALFNAFQISSKHPRSSLPFQRFWESVDFDGPIHPHNPSQGRCWLWTKRSEDKDGYGTFLVFKSRKAKISFVMRAHRFSWWLSRGFDPGDSLVCHSCDVVRCCRPGHMFLGTAGDNYRDMAAKGRRYDTRGHDHPGNKYTAEQIGTVRALLAEGVLNQREIGRRTGVHFAMVNNIHLGKAWTHDYAARPTYRSQRRDQKSSPVIGA